MKARLNPFDGGHLEMSQVNRELLPLGSNRARKVSPSCGCAHRVSYPAVETLTTPSHGPHSVPKPDRPSPCGFAAQVTHPPPGTLPYRSRGYPSPAYKQGN